MSKNKASYALWEAGHRTLSRNLKNLTREEYEKIFGKKKDLSQISQILSQTFQGHAGEILGKVYFYFLRFLDVLLVYCLLNCLRCFIPEPWFFLFNGV